LRNKWIELNYLKVAFIAFNYQHERIWKSTETIYW